MPVLNAKKISHLFILNLFFRAGISYWEYVRQFPMLHFHHYAFIAIVTPIILFLR